MFFLETLAITELQQSRVLAVFGGFWLLLFVVVHIMRLTHCLGCFGCCFYKGLAISESLSACFFSSVLRSRSLSEGVAEGIVLLPPSEHTKRKTLVCSDILG